MNLMAMQFQQYRQGLSRILVVIDNEDATHGGGVRGFLYR
jgi:hypothetical protein